MSNAQNGARIKAWAGSGVGSGLVKNITFDGFVEDNVDNPVVIDQCYMTDADECAEHPSNTYIQDIWFTKCVETIWSGGVSTRHAETGSGFNSISGTSSGKEKAVVASLSCSPDGRCSNVNVEGITVTYVDRLVGDVLADNCVEILGLLRNTVPPSSIARTSN